MTSNKREQIEVMTSKERRRRWAPAEKKHIVQETYEPGVTVSLVARRQGIPPSQLFYWRRRMEEGALTAVLVLRKKLFRKVRSVSSKLADFTPTDPYVFTELTPPSFHLN